MAISIYEQEVRLIILKKAAELCQFIDDAELVILAEAYQFIQDDWCDDSSKKLIDSYETLIEYYTTPLMKEWFDQLPRGKQVDPYA